MNRNFKKYKNIIVSLVIFLIFLGVVRITNAITNIDPTDYWAWNYIVGWFDFYSTNNVYVYADRLSGYADSPIGEIALNCDSTPNGNICSGAGGNWKITNTDGTLSGYAWNDGIGWISFNCSNTDTCGTVDYKVQISTTTSQFSGWAWNDFIGWISFNCSNTDTCGTVDYSTATSWTSNRFTGNLTSEIFDTQVVEGSALNSIMWQGDNPTGTNVKFQIASINSLEGGGSGVIDYIYRYAWNDSIGWIDFGYSSGNVMVGDDQLTGYAYNNNILEIALDCATSPAGNLCSSSDFKINYNSTTGDLSGYAWNDRIGWISFNCSDPDLCATSNYKVNINTTSGAFTGWAWNDMVGWISFNCSDTTDNCVSSNYHVNTSSSGTWNFVGPDGTDSSYYNTSGPSIPVEISLAHHNNKRYFRYKIFLESDSTQTLTPTITNVIMNWSP